MVASAGVLARANVDKRPVPIRHVFMIVLENKNFADTFGTSTQDPYLQKTLVPQGALLTQYYGTGHASLDNYLSIISGQAPTPDTANDCVTSTSGELGNFNEVEKTGMTPDGQVIAQHGCVYPREVQTLVDQLDRAGFDWKAYMEDMGNDPARESSTCGHPLIGLSTDRTNDAEGPSASVPQGDAYATRHNPFMYFHSIIDSPTCHTHVVNLSHLKADLARTGTTANFVFITPNLCHDGHDGAGTGAPGTTCANGEPGGLTSTDAFLKNWVPRILASPAYRKDGLLIITFDEGNYTESVTTHSQTGKVTDTIAFPGQHCCDQRPGPNLEGVRPGTVTVSDSPTKVVLLVNEGYGGDRIGALLLSPFVKPGSVSDTPYNHYSLLRSLEDLFGIAPHLGYAADNPASNYAVKDISNDPGIFRDPIEHGH
jgi:hypothetical protein